LGAFPRESTAGGRAFLPYPGRRGCAPHPGGSSRAARKICLLIGAPYSAAARSPRERGRQRPALSGPRVRPNRCHPEGGRVRVHHKSTRRSGPAVFRFGSLRTRAQSTRARRTAAPQRSTWLWVAATAGMGGGEGCRRHGGSAEARRRAIVNVGSGAREPALDASGAAGLAPAAGALSVQHDRRASWFGGPGRRGSAFALGMYQGHSGMKGPCSSAGPTGVERSGFRRPSRRLPNRQSPLRSYLAHPTSFTPCEQWNSPGLNHLTQSNRRQGRSGCVLWHWGGPSCRF